MQPLIRGTGDITDSHVEVVSERLGLVPGHMALSTFEDDLAEVWPKCLDGDLRAFQITSAFYGILRRAAGENEADVVLIDLGPNLAAINRATVLASDFVVTPLGLDAFSVQALINLGTAMRHWREQWKQRLSSKPVEDLDLPAGTLQPLGYIILRRAIRLDRPTRTLERCVVRLPSTYAESVLQQQPPPSVTVGTDPNCIAVLKDHRSLLPLAQDARKPMFFLKPADGAMGAFSHAVSEAYKDFKAVAQTIAARAGIKPPD